MKDAFKSFRVTLDKGDGETQVVWRKYRDSKHRNAAKRFRRTRVVAGQESPGRTRRARYYRPVGRSGRVRD